MEKRRNPEDTGTEVDALSALADTGLTDDALALVLEG